MLSNYSSPRLSLRKLSVQDAAFIQRLVNTPGWLRFIGDRNVRSIEDAIAYIQRILDNPFVLYWVVSDSLVPVGVVTFLKKEYLEHWDVGFAFLPEYSKKGYAFEAASTILAEARKEHPHVLAITNKENLDSINLLVKLGFAYSKEITVEADRLLVYAIG